jgi:hypothetical protein
MIDAIPKILSADSFQVLAPGFASTIERQAHG